MCSSDLDPVTRVAGALAFHAVADLKERKRWDDYVKAYEAALSRCSTSSNPWFVIPSNKKWFRNLAVSQIIVETLERMNPKFPKAAFDISKLKVK